MIHSNMRIMGNSHNGAVPLEMSSRSYQGFALTSQSLLIVPSSNCFVLQRISPVLIGEVSWIWKFYDPVFRPIDFRGGWDATWLLGLIRSIGMVDLIVYRYVRRAYR